MIESDFTSNIHKKLDPRIVKAWKIKDDYQGGVFDAMYFSEINNSGVVLPPVCIEYKLIKALPKRETTRIIPDLSELQKQWITRAEIAKLPVYVIVGLSEAKKPAKGVIYKSPVEWFDGLPRDEFESRLQPYNELAGFITSHFIGG